VIAVIPCVHYADFLAVTLPAWQQALPGATIRVTTAPDDRKTPRVCARAGVDVVRTKAWLADRAKLNKAKALDEAFSGTAPGELCLSIDADVYPCGRFPAESTFVANALYGCERYLCRSMRECRSHLSGETPREALSLMDSRLGDGGYGVVPNTPVEVARLASEGPGYLQAFRYDGRRFGSYPTAGFYDSAFTATFTDKRPIADFYVLHLGPSRGRNWSGRVVPTWRAA
jgi:hypothetical protein